MKKTKYVVISAVVAVFVAFALVSSATAVPVTNSQPIQENLEKRSKLNELMDVENIELDVNRLQKFQRFSRMPKLNVDEFTVEDAEAEIRKLFDVEAIQQKIEGMELKDMDMDNIMDSMDINWCPFLILFIVCIEASLVLFGRNLIAFFIGYIIAFSIAFIPGYILAYILSVYVIVLVVIDAAYYDLPDNLFNDFGIVGVLFAFIFIVVLFVIMIPISIVVSLGGAFLVISEGLNMISIELAKYFSDFFGLP